MSSPSENKILKRLPANQSKFIEFTHYLANHLDFLGDVVKQQVLDSVVFAPVEFQHEMVSDFLENQKNKTISKAIADEKKEKVIEKKNADKQSKLDEKRRAKEEKELAKKEERERVKEEKRVKKQLEKAENEKKKKELKIKNSKKNPIVVSDNITATEDQVSCEATNPRSSNVELATEEFVGTPNKEEPQVTSSPSNVKKAIKKRVVKKKKEEDKA
jgi:phage-related minor tail protein